jgi:hypothetical protein
VFGLFDDFQHGATPWQIPSPDQDFVGGSCPAQGSQRELDHGFLILLKQEPHVKPEVCAVRAEFPSFTELALQQSLKISAKSARIWVKCSARIRWVLARQIAAYTGVLCANRPCALKECPALQEIYEK